MAVHQPRFKARQTKEVVKDEIDKDDMLAFEESILPRHNVVGSVCLLAVIEYRAHKLPAPQIHACLVRTALAGEIVQPALFVAHCLSSRQVLRSCDNVVHDTPVEVMAKTGWLLGLRPRVTLLDVLSHFQTRRGYHADNQSHYLRWWVETTADYTLDDAVAVAQYLCTQARIADYTWLLEYLIPRAQTAAFFQRFDLKDPGWRLTREYIYLQYRALALAGVEQPTWSCLPLHRSPQAEYTRGRAEVRIRIDNPTTPVIIYAVSNQHDIITDEAHAVSFPEQGQPYMYSFHLSAGRHEIDNPDNFYNVYRQRDIAKINIEGEIIDASAALIEQLQARNSSIPILINRRCLEKYLKKPKGCDPVALKTYSTFLPWLKRVGTDHLVTLTAHALDCTDISVPDLVEYFNCNQSMQRRHQLNDKRDWRAYHSKMIMIMLNLRTAFHQRTIVEFYHQLSISQRKCLVMEFNRATS